MHSSKGVNPGGWGVATTQDFGVEGSQGVVGSWTGREILLYLFMPRKYMYVQKWLLLKRNRIICPEVAINGQFLPGKSNSFVKLHRKIEISRKFTWKIEILLTRIHDPQISNQPDALHSSQR